MRLSHLQEADEFSADRNHGVEKEINNFAIYINGRLWKVIKGVAPDDDPEQVRKAEQLRRMCEQKTLATGKIWTCLETSQDPTDTLKPASTPSTSPSPIPSSDSDITTNFQVFINGRSWRVFKGAGPDNSLAQRSEMTRLQKMCDRKSVQTGRKWEVKPTKAEPTPSGPRPHITEKQINMPARFSPGDEVRVKNHPELQGVLVKMLADNAALVNFEIDDDHEPVESEVDLTDLEPATLHELDANQRRAGQAGPMDKAPLRGKLVGDGLEEEDVAAGSDYTPPKLGTVRANLMHTQEPTVQVQVFKHNTLRGDSYWVTKEVKKFKTMDLAQAFIDRINKQGVAEGDVFFIEMGSTLIETTVLRANHDTVLLAADDTVMSLLEASNIMEAEYHGRNVPLGKPMQGDVKKFKVYVKDPKTGNVKKVNFGDKTMRIKKSNPARRKSFRARHNCANPGPRTKARYWSCRKW